MKEAAVEMLKEVEEVEGMSLVSSVLRKSHGVPVIIGLAIAVL